jgi:hypothetical protein
LVSELHRQAKNEGILYEILCFDDGSTLEIVENQKINSLTNSTFKKFDSNIGRTAIRNLMAQKASFEYLLFLDADMFPKSADFLKNYVAELHITKDSQAVFGGCAYNSLNQKRDLLRFRYGQKREEQPAILRNKKPFKNIYSGNVLIHKPLFIATNTILKSRYGLDLFFSSQLQRMKCIPKHIDNEVYHNGLESNAAFLKKSKEGVKTIWWLYKNNHISEEQSQLIVAHRWLKKWKVVKLFRVLGSDFINPVERLLKKNKAPLVFFDFYRLYYYVTSKGVQ